MEVTLAEEIIQLRSSFIRIP